MKETWVQFLGWEDIPQKGVATPSVFLPFNPRGAWRGGLQTVHGIANSQTRLGD